jgi:hypothetical protein
MKTINEKNSVFDYDAITELASELWQKQGCCFGQYMTCFRQATEQFLGASQMRNGQAKKRGKKKELAGKRANISVTL